MTDPITAARRTLDEIRETAGELHKRLDAAERDETLTTIGAARLLLALGGIRDSLAVELDGLNSVVGE